jgi:hypothetical protein
MEKYTKSVRKAFTRNTDSEGKPIIEPFRDAQEWLQKSRFADQAKEEFFTDVYSDIIVDLFVLWLKSPPHAQKEREYYYHSALALGSVKEKLIQYQHRGRNAEFMAIQKKKAQEAQDEEDNTQ